MFMPCGLLFLRLVLHREQRRRGGRDEDRQQNGPRALGKGARQRQHRAKPAGREAHAHAAEHDRVFLRRRDDDRQKHAEQRDGQRADHACGQDAPGRDAQRRADGPAGNSGHERAVGVEGVEIPGPRDGDAEQLVRHVVADEQPVVQRRVGRKFLAERAAHQQIPRVGDERDERHLHKAAVGGDDGEGRVFAGRGIVEQADQKALKGVEARAAGGNAERKRHGEIAEADRNAVADAGEKVPAPHGALCCIHMRKILFSARHAVR